MCSSRHPVTVRCSPSQARAGHSRLSLISEAAWREAQRRAEVIRALTERERRPRHLVQAAAATLGLSERQTYTLLRRCREAGGDLTALLPGMSSGGRDKPKDAARE